MVSEKQKIAFLLSLANDNVPVDIQEAIAKNGILKRALTAAEQAEPAPAAKSGSVKVLTEDDYEEIINAAAIKMRKATSGVRGQVITVQDSLDWWVMKETERRILTAAEQAEPAPSARSGVVKVDELAQEIRRVDGSNSLGAGALAEALMPFLAAIEPAEPATDAEREFSEVLDGAQAFNDALPERMRKNARDWLRPDDEQVADEEPFESCPDCAGSGYSNHPDSGQVCYRCNGQGSYTHRHALTAAEQDQEDRS